MARGRAFGAILVVGAVMSLGCPTHTEVGGDYHFPPGSDHATAQYHLIVSVAGASRRAYTDRTLKTIYLTIKSGDTPVLSREYTLTAASLDWNVKWEERGDLEILFFDLPEGVSIYSPNAEPVKAMQEMAVRFTFDEAAKKFVEAQAPPDVIRLARVPK